MKPVLLLASLAILGCTPEAKEDNESSILRDAAEAPIEAAEAVEDVVLESKSRIDEAVDEADD